MRTYWKTHRAFRDAWYGSLGFGSIGWMTGATINGPLYGADPYGGLLLFTTLFGAIGWIVGFVVGKTVEQSVTYYQGPDPADASREPTA